MGPTMQDICFLTGLPAHGEEANCFLTQKTPLFTYDNDHLAYAHFITRWRGKGTITDSEHMTFLIYWLNKWVFCVASAKITKDFTDLAKALASSQKIALAPLELAHLYKGMNELDHKFLFSAGPL